MRTWNPDDAGDSIVTTKISSGRINSLLFIFNFFFITVGLLALSRDLNFTGVILEKDSLQLWNGYASRPCWVSWIYASVKFHLIGIQIGKSATHLPSLMRHLTVEAYTKLGFRFAFMFSGLIRIFISYWRSHTLMYNALKKEKNSSVVFWIYRALPLVLGVQILFGAIMMTTSTHIDEYYMPHLSEMAIKVFFYATALYMCLVVACDWSEASGFWVSDQDVFKQVVFENYSKFIMAE